MTRKKSNLSLHHPKHRQASNNNNASASSITTKRKFFKSPKSTPRKSPFRSPLYTASPYAKKQKTLSPRNLFNSSTSETSNNDHLDLTYSEGAVSLPPDVASSSSTPSASDECNTPENPSPAAVKESLKSIIPSVVDNLAKENRLDLTILSFFQQVSDKNFPLDNIAFLLWTEVVKWFKCETTTTMRYSSQTKMFWKLGWRIFGGKFVNFMGGFKSHGDTVLKMAERGHFSPASSEINFAVPSVKVLREYDPYAVQGERTPGIYSDIMFRLSSNLQNHSSCLTFDGKKLKQSLTPTSGDVDLLGFGTEESISERKAKLSEKTAAIQALLNPMNELDNHTSVESSCLTHEYVVSLKKQLKQSFTDICKHVIEVEEIKRKKDYCKKKKLIERGGDPDWY